jgi:5'(3')-deoxyribonucleotidase
MKIGIDVGGVLANKQHEGKLMPFAAEVLGELATAHKLYIVSQCGKARAEHTKGWLADQGVPIPLPDQFYVGFKEQNKNRLLKRLAIDVFIDDRAKHIRPALELRIYCLHFSDSPLDVRSRHYAWVKDWLDVREFFRRTK